MAIEKISKESIRKQLLEGVTPEAIAKYQGCTRQYISLIKQGLVKEGRMPKAPAGRKPRVEALATPKPIDVEFDQAVDIMTDALNALKEKPGLEALIKKYKNGYERAMELLAQKEKSEQKRIKQEQRWNLAKQKPSLAEV